MHVPLPPYPHGYTWQEFLLARPADRPGQDTWQQTDSAVAFRACVDVDARRAEGAPAVPPSEPLRKDHSPSLPRWSRPRHTTSRGGAAQRSTSGTINPPQPAACSLSPTRRGAGGASDFAVSAVGGRWGCPPVRGRADDPPRGSPRRAGSKRSRRSEAGLRRIIVGGARADRAGHSARHRDHSGEYPFAPSSRGARRHRCPGCDGQADDHGRHKDRERCDRDMGRSSQEEFIVEAEGGGKKHDLFDGCRSGRLYVHRAERRDRLSYGRGLSRLLQRNGDACGGHPVIQVRRATSTVSDVAPKKGPDVECSGAALPPPGE